MDHQEAMRRAKKLVAQMTVEEKASQLRYDAPAIERLGIPAYNWWNEALHGVARAGTATVFPQAIALAAMFDADLVRGIADVISTEGRAKYNAASAAGDRDIYKGLTFWSPNINIFRDPRWGRGQETYGEDPYLTARTGCAFVRGVQGEKDAKYLKAAACAKHLAVHSGPESERHRFDIDVSEKDLRETYLYAFEKIVKEAGVEAVMGAYNRFRGEPCCANSHLMEILREEWGFEGHFVSDCWAISDFHNNHMVTSTAPESAALALKAGCDVNCGVTYLHVLAALQEGRVTEEDITRACERLMATRFRLGLFADDCPYDAIPFTENDTDGHASLALRAAEKCMVLLKNDGTLPLDPAKVRTLAVIGPNANSIPVLEGNYNGTSSRYVTFLEGIRAACEERGIRVLYAQGSHLWNDKEDNLALPGARLAEAVATARAADAVVLCVGLDATMEGEEGDASNAWASGDRPDLELPACQRRLVEAVMAAGTPVVTVNASGSAVAVTEGNAILQAWYPGQAGGNALANILFGKVSPSGKLPVTFYRSVDDLPDFHNYDMEGRTYRYFAGDALYPFGYGLTYTHFAYGQPEFDGGDAFVTVRNAGEREAEAVVEAYVRAENCPFAPRNPVLCGYERVLLKPGESKRVRVAVNPDAFTAVNEAGERVSAGDRFTLWLGGSQPDARTEALSGERAAVLSIHR